jgi:hypothetical protein
MYRERYKIEGKHAEQKSRHGLWRARHWGLAKVHLQAIVTATLTNLKRLAKLLAPDSAWCGSSGRRREEPARPPPNRDSAQTRVDGVNSCNHAPQIQRAQQACEVGTGILHSMAFLSSSGIFS